MQLNNKNVAITGATSGIGRGIALGMAREGANIATIYLDTEHDKKLAESLEQEIKQIRNSDNCFVAIAGDVSNPETAVALVKITVEKFGQIDVMVANAGICIYKPFMETSHKLYYDHIRINLDGVYFMVQEAGRQMLAQGKGGSIIATGSVRSRSGNKFLVPYTASKGGVLSIVQAAACDLGIHNIRVNCLLPGAIMTPLNEAQLSNEEREKVTSQIPMGRMGTPEDLVGPAVFLASDMSKYVNGGEILVDGGLLVQLE